MSADAKAVLEAAVQVFRTEQGAKAFLGMKNAQLGGVPLRLVEEGRGDEVVAYLTALREQAPPAQGSYWQVVAQQWAGGLMGPKRKR
jgi:hypothetical protein